MRYKQRFIGIRNVREIYFPKIKLRVSRVKLVDVFHIKFHIKLFRTNLLG